MAENGRYPKGQPKRCPTETLDALHLANVPVELQRQLRALFHGVKFLARLLETLTIPPVHVSIEQSALPLFGGWTLSGMEYQNDEGSPAMLRLVLENEGLGRRATLTLTEFSEGQHPEDSVRAKRLATVPSLPQQS